MSEPLDGNLLRADPPVSDPRLRVAVPITASGAEQAQPKSDVRETGAQIRVVARVPRFHRIQTIFLEPRSLRCAADTTPPAE